ncbi:MAG TPA: IS91 family transposase [Thermoanaerobaculia bacterium]|nr:IS91 family transposase [Thermoanaerobaculia bacterium]
MADIVRRFGPAFRDQHQGQLSRAQLRTLGAIEDCRTAALGGHEYECAHCGARKIAYNSCRNRHCPKCQSLEKEQWLEQRCAELLPIPYFHVVFTLPEELNPLALSHPQFLYNLLFRCASQTLLELAANPKHLGARIGVLAVLHTWGQKLTLHPHLHCIVTSGGLSIDGDWWVGCRPSFFLSVRVLRKLFRGKVLAALKAAKQNGDLPACYLPDLDPLYRKSWVVYCKPPFGSPGQVLAYLARYTHRIAITNSRLVRLEGKEVTFTWKDYADHDRIREMTLSGEEEFLRRFLLHVLPDRFVRIRYYGLLANRHREKTLALCREVLPGAPARPKPAKTDWRDRLQSLTGIDPLRCEVCGQKALRLIGEVAPARAPRAPPR